ncbi:MAG: excinuclease ABC subunit UvrA, partial [Candidatus Latescibacteria bacterium]|nr:excinuclease ABC subunit UvrA [Candidatus Latescibacterota bacterium]
MKDVIFVKGAREHNLKSIDVTIPRNTFTVITGLSGSGKSSLAFDTIYAEGQRRYVESLSAYARQFLGLMEKPDVEYIEGLSPAISIEQSKGSHNPRSTVGTVTEIYDYLRLLYARLGTPHCPNCGRKISQQTPQEIVDTVTAMPAGTRIQVLAPLVRGRKGEYQDIFKRARLDGYVRVRVDGDIRNLDEDISLDKKVKHAIEVVVDRLVVSKKIRMRLTDSVETALKLAEGLVIVNAPDLGGDRLFSEHFACHDCGISLEEIEPRLFSFNSPYGACPACSGLGTLPEIDPEKVVPDDSIPIVGGAIKPWGVPRGHWYYKQVFSLADHYGEDITLPYKKLSKRFRNAVLYGTGRTKIRHVGGSGDSIRETNAPFEGVIPNLERRYRQTESAGVRSWIEGFMRSAPCHECGGSRLKREALAVTFRGRNIHEATTMAIGDALTYFESLELDEREELVARQILKEIRQRLAFMNNVGLDYLT